MGIAHGWEKRAIRTNISYSKRTFGIFSVSPHSRSQSIISCRLKGVVKPYKQLFRPQPPHFFNIPVN